MDKLFIKLESTGGKELCRKTSVDSYTPVNKTFTIVDVVSGNKKTVGALTYILFQYNQKLDFLQSPLVSVDELPLPKLDFSIFDKFDSRQVEIAENKSIKNKFKKSRFKILDGTKLVCVKASSGFSDVKEFYLVKDNQFTRAEGLLDADTLSKAIVFDMPLDRLKKVLKDNLENEFESDYNEAKKLWNEI